VQLQHASGHSRPRGSRRRRPHRVTLPSRQDPRSGILPAGVQVQPFRSYVFMIFRPAFRLLTGPLPPLRLAARALAAVILPPLLFFIVSSPCAGSVTLVPTENTVLAVRGEFQIVLRTRPERTRRSYQRPNPKPLQVHSAAQPLPRGRSQSVDTARGSKCVLTCRPEITPPSASDTTHGSAPASDTSRASRVRRPTECGPGIRAE
jgi:hypothetical protein